jgi:hypothetical protein
VSRYAPVGLQAAYTYSRRNSGPLDETGRRVPRWRHVADSPVAIAGLTLGIGSRLNRCHQLGLKLVRANLVQQLAVEVEDCGLICGPARWPWSQSRSGARTRGVRIIPDRLRPARGFHGFLAHPTGSTPPLGRDNTAPGPSLLAYRQPPAPLSLRPARTVSLVHLPPGKIHFVDLEPDHPRFSAPPTRSAVQSQSAVGCRAIRAHPWRRGPRCNGSPHCRSWSWNRMFCRFP